MGFDGKRIWEFGLLVARAYYKGKRSIIAGDI